MAIKIVRCSVLGRNVECLTALNGETTKVICPAYEESTRACRLKRDALG